MISICRCNHSPVYLIEEIAAGRYVQKFQEDEYGAYELICPICGGLWDHDATDWLIEHMMAPERAPILEPWEWYDVLCR